MRWCSAAAFAAAFMFALTPSAGAATTPVTGTGAAFADSVGVNIHEFYPDGAYADKTRLKNLLVELGVKHVRDGVRFEREPYRTEYPSARDIAAAGIKFLWGVGDPVLTPYARTAYYWAGDRVFNGSDRPPPEAPKVYTPNDVIDLLTDPARLGGTAEAFEGPNEFDKHRGTLEGSTWAADLLAFQSGHYAALKSHAEFGTMPFWGPSFMRPAGRKEYAGLPGAATVQDRPNAHVYPGGKTPETEMPKELSAVRADFGASAATPVITETGYHNAIHNGNSGHFGVSERAQSIYIARALLKAFALGVPRTYLYQLIDEKPETALVDMERHFGLVAIEGTGPKETWTARRKPAFTTLREMLEITRDPSTAGRPASLDFSLSGAPATLEKVLLARSGGAVDLVLWNAVPVYNFPHVDCNDPRIPPEITDPHLRCEHAKYELAVDAGDAFPADVQVGLQLGRAADVSVERPHSQTSFTSLGQGTSFSLAVGADPLFVRVRPAGPSS